MSKDMPDDVRYVISGRVSDTGTVDHKLPLRRFLGFFRENDFYKLPFVGKGGQLPEGFEAQPFLPEHFYSGARYVEAIFQRDWVNLILCAACSSDEDRMVYHKPPACT